LDQPTAELANRANTSHAVFERAGARSTPI
jgi:hypothetical protein